MNHVIPRREVLQMKFDSTRKNKPFVSGDTKMSEAQTETQDNTVKPATNVENSTATTTLTEKSSVVHASDMASEILEELEKEKEDEVESSLSYLGDDSTLCTVRPSIIVMLSLTDTDMYQDQAGLREFLETANNGDIDVNVYNPFAKGSTGKTPGALRMILPQVFSAANLLASQPLVIMGESSSAVNSVQRNLSGRINSLIQSAYNSEGPGYQFFSNDEPASEDSDVSENSGLVAEVGINDLINVSSWVSAESEGSVQDELEANVVTNINVNMPMLYGCDNMKKSLYEIIKVISGVVKSIGNKHAEAVDIAFALTISNEMMASPAIRELMADLFDATDDNGKTMYQFVTANAVHLGEIGDGARSLLHANTGNVTGADSVLEAVFSHGGAVTFIRNL